MQNKETGMQKRGWSRRQISRAASQMPCLLGSSGMHSESLQLCEPGSQQGHCDGDDLPTAENMVRR